MHDTKTKKIRKEAIDYFQVIHVKKRRNQTGLDRMLRGLWTVKECLKFVLNAIEILGELNKGITECYTFK